MNITTMKKPSKSRWFSNKTLPADITTAELMKVDLSYNFTEEELRKDWERLKSVEEFKKVLLELERREMLVRLIA